MINTSSRNCRVSVKGFFSGQLGMKNCSQWRTRNKQFFEADLMDEAF